MVLISPLVRGQVPGISRRLKYQNKILSPEDPSYCPQYSNNHGWISQFFILIFQSKGKHYAETKSKKLLMFTKMVGQVRIFKKSRGRYAPAPEMSTFDT